jgi:iron(III) transport system substrate-binding protein
MPERILPWLALPFVLVLACSPAPAAAPTAAPAAATTSGQPLEQRLYEAAKKEGTVVWWYTSPPEEAQQFQQRFEGKYPGVKLVYQEGNVGELTQKFTLEAQAKKVSVDVFGSNQESALAKQGLVSDLSDLMEDTKFNPALAAADHTGAGVGYTVDGVGYNTNLVSPADVPKSWDALLDPKYKNKLGVEDRLTTFVHYTDVAGYGGKRPGLWSEDKAVDYLTKLKAQSPRVISSNTTMASIMAAGELPIGVGLHMQSFRRLQDKGAPVEWAPMEQNIVLASTLMVVPKDAPHANAARLYIRWLMSPDGQTAYEDIRGQGDPSSGAGTGQSNYLEKRGVKLVFAGDEINDEYDRIQMKYRAALGLN